jgi:hypothetical protein
MNATKQIATNAVLTGIVGCFDDQKYCLENPLPQPLPREGGGEKYRTLLPVGIGFSPLPPRGAKVCTHFFVPDIIPYFLIDLGV